MQIYMQKKTKYKVPHHPLHLIVSDFKLTIPEAVVRIWIELPTVCYFCTMYSL